MIFKFLKKMFSNESPSVNSLHNKKNSIDNTELNENTTFSEISETTSEEINIKTKQDDFTQSNQLNIKCLNPNSIFHLNIYGDINDIVYNHLKEILNQTDKTGGLIAKEVTKLFFENNITCKEIDDFHKVQTSRLSKIRKHNRPVSELYTTNSFEVEEMIHFIENYELVKNSKNELSGLSYDSIAFYLQYTWQWDKIITIYPDNMSKDILEMLLKIQILLPATKSPIDVRIKTLLVPELKNICKELNIKPKGKKNDIIEQLLQVENISEIINLNKDFKDQFFINHPSKIINSYEKIFDYFKVIDFIGRIFSFTYISSKRSLSDYDRFVAAGIKSFHLFTHGCNCTSEFRGNNKILVKKSNFPPYELGCRCYAEANFNLYE